MKAMREKKVEWWSIKGTPLIGYASIEKQIVKISAKTMLIFNLLKKLKINKVITQLNNELWDM